MRSSNDDSSQLWRSTMASTDVITNTALRDDFYIEGVDDVLELEGEARHFSPTHRADLCSTCGMGTMSMRIRTVAEQDLYEEVDRDAEAGADDGEAEDGDEDDGEDDEDDEDDDEDE